MSNDLNGCNLAFDGRKRQQVAKMDYFSKISFFFPERTNSKQCSDIAYKDGIHGCVGCHPLDCMRV